MNNVTLTGNLTKDIELRETPSGKEVTTLSVAVKRPFSEETDFFNVNVWGKQAQNCSKFLKKGSKVGVNGYIFTRKYEDKDGIKRTVTEINANEVEFLSPKNEETAEVTREREELTEIDGEGLPF